MPVKRSIQMNGNYALDTNIVRGYLNFEESIHTNMKQADRICIPSIVLGELYFGARKSAKIKTNTSRLDKFRSQSSILNCDADTAVIYGALREELGSKGKP